MRIPGFGTRGRSVALAALAVVALFGLGISLLAPALRLPSVTKLGWSVQARAGALRAFAAGTNPIYGLHTQLNTQTSQSRIDAALDRSYESGSEWTRFTVGWPTIDWSADRQANGADLHFEVADYLVQGVSGRSMKPLMTIMHTPTWASSASGCPGTCSTDYLKFPPTEAGHDDWRYFISEIAKHYAAACASDSSMCVAGYEIGNEPTLQSYFKGTPEQYARLLTIAHDEIKAAYAPYASDPSVVQPLVLLGGLSDNTNNAPSLEDWTSRAMNYVAPESIGAAAAKMKFDVAAVHLRGSDTYMTARTAWWDARFAQFNSAAPMWITEFGYPSDNSEQVAPYKTTTDMGDPNDPLEWEQRQAEYLTYVVPTVFASGAQALFMTLNDEEFTGDASTNWFETEGLVLNDLTYKKLGFQAWGDLAGNTPELPAVPLNLTGSAPNHWSMSLFWLDQAYNETAYVVERKTFAATTWTSIATLPGNSTKYTDTTVASYTGYHYRVRASNSVGASAYTNTIAPSTPAKPAYTRVDQISLGANGLLPTTSWKPFNDSRAYGGSIHAAASTSAKATWSWNGTDVQVIMVKGPRMGKVTISVDGAAATVDLYSAGAVAQALVFTRENLAGGAHTILIQPSGQKNTASSGTNIGLDAIDYR